MSTRSNWELRQWAAALLIGCLLASSASLGLLINSTPVMGANAAPAQTAYLQPPTEMRSTETVPAAIEDATITDDQAYVAVSSRSHYQATASHSGKRFTYTIQSGDTLWQIADDYHTDPSTLFSLNPDLEGTIIRPGEELEVIPEFRGLNHTVKWGETLSEIASAYDLPMSEIMDANQLEASDHLQVGQDLLLPGAQVRQERSMAASSRDGSSRRGALGWIWPITGGLYSSEFGESRWGSVHTGIDIAVPTGTPAAAVANGTVIFSGWDSGYGYTVIIDHGGGVQTRYAHASQLLVSDGQRVSQGETVMRVGATGNSTGPHLHFEVLVEGEARNPRLYLP